MKPQEELHYLKLVLRELESESRAFILSRWVPVASWLLGVVYFLLLFQLQSRMHTLLFVFLATSAGVVAGVVAFWRVCASRWPCMKPHIDRASISQRIRELES